jgi:uncharacterized membrane protein YGL010W
VAFVGAAHRLSALEGFLLLILGAFAASFLVLSWELGQTAAMFPRLVASVSLALLGLAIVLDFIGRGEARKKTPEALTPEAPDAISWPVALAVQIGYIVLVVLLGFSLATLIYLLGSPLQMRYHRWAVLGAFAILLTVAVVGSFTYLFHVRLPEGLLWSSLKSRF